MFGELERCTRGAAYEYAGGAKKADEIRRPRTRSPTIRSAAEKLRKGVDALRLRRSDLGNHLPELARIDFKALLAEVHQLESAPRRVVGRVAKPRFGIGHGAAE